jgi:hypothetical protein
MVGATDTIFFAAVTVVSGAGTTVVFTHSVVPVTKTIVFATHNIFLIRETISATPANR